MQRSNRPATNSAILERRWQNGVVFADREHVVGVFGSSYAKYAASSTVDWQPGGGRSWMMSLAPWVRKLKLKVIRDQRLKSRYLLTNDDFRFEAARERVRTDRTGSPLAILLIELPSDRSAPRDFLFLSRILERRLRITDTAGFVSERRVGVLLPDTPSEGAWKVASDICDIYPVGHDRPDCEVFVYPDDASPSGDRRGKEKELPAGNAQSQFDSLFVYSTPLLKRTIDVLGASLGLLVAAPLFAVIAAAIKATSSGPVFYSQEREGHGGRIFRIYKFRTMRPDAHYHQSTLRAYSEQDGPAFKMSNDPRTTWIGRWLRKSSLDELPQLWNVLVGDMSLVGPRPLPTEESVQCNGWQRHRLAVLPGLTCLWQIRGRNTVSFVDWMRMDLAYLRRRSLTYDVNLLAQTLPALLFQRGPR
jgi:lipopolysaccharide/colanic/teichoic acid biosynthesis glycosyltransferase